MKIENVISNTKRSSLSQESACQNYKKQPTEVFCKKKGVLKNFTKFTGKHLSQSHFFNKVAGLRGVTLLKKRLWHSCFPVNFVKLLGTPFLNISGQINASELWTNSVGWFNLCKIRQSALTGTSGLGNMKVCSELFTFYHC